MTLSAGPPRCERARHRFAPIFCLSAGEREARLKAMASEKARKAAEKEAIQRRVEEDKRDKAKRNATLAGKIDGGISARRAHVSDVGPMIKS